MKQNLQDFYDDGGLFSNPYFLFFFFTAFSAYLFTFGLFLSMISKEDVRAFRLARVRVPIGAWLTLPLHITLQSYLLCRIDVNFYLVLIPLLILLLELLSYLYICGGLSKEVLVSLNLVFESIVDMYTLHIMVLLLIHFLLLPSGG